jgi:AraC-like DNA-binding protein
MAPMEYLLAWRVALAKKMLLSNEGNVAEVAERVGYGSASAFSTAFTRFVGSPPSRFVQKQMEVET